MKTLVRHFLSQLALLVALAFSPAWADQTRVEIFFLPHRPAIKVADSAEMIAREFSNVTVIRYSFDDSDSQERVMNYGLTEHLPVAIFINGQNQFTVNGQSISFLNFPKSDTFIPSFAGEWDYADLKAVLSELSQ
jgi:hypothetical protein